MTPPPGRETLVDNLRDHNPWWTDGATALAPHLPARHRSDYYHLARPDEDGSQFEDQSILGLVGRQGVGKTTLLKQFIYGRLTDGDAPERFCYLPFDANPLYQLDSDHQLQQAIHYYETRILGRLDDPEPHFLLVDDVHRIEHPQKAGINGWGTPIADALDTVDGRHVVVTASAGIQVDRELVRGNVPTSARDIQPILPEKFRDYLFTLYPPLEDNHRRVTPTPLRTGDGSLPDALDRDDPEALVETIREQYVLVEDLERRIQSQVVHYLAMGGIISYAHDGPVEDATTLPATAYDRLREDLRAALYQEVPAFETINTIADLERLCALAARSHGGEPVRFQHLVDLFDVDRRTIRDSYLEALRQLYLLTPATEYDNARPRSVHLYLRDTGLATALTDGDSTAVLHDHGRETALARLAAYDHTKRLAYGINAIQGYDTDSEVAYWTHRDGTVDYVFEVDDVPVPVGFAYEPPVDSAHAALDAFHEEFATEIGFLIVGDTVPENRVTRIDDRSIQLPYWLFLLLC